LAALDALTWLDADLAQVGVERDPVVAVVHVDDVAVAALPAGEADGALAHDPDRRAVRGGVVDAAVLAHPLQQGVHADREG
jgi:hypothetical protein